MTPFSRRGARRLLILLLASLGMAIPGLAELGLEARAAVAADVPAAGANEPVAVLVTAATDPSGSRITLTFSRRVDYRLEESRSKLRVVLSEPVAESSMVDQDLDSDVVKR